jgi:hypothetical protein
MKPKLTLRDLLAIVTIVAMALGWWADRSRLANRVDILARELSFVTNYLNQQGMYLVQDKDGNLDFALGTDSKRRIHRLQAQDSPNDSP